MKRIKGYAVELDVELMKMHPDLCIKATLSSIVLEPGKVVLIPGKIVALYEEEVDPIGG